MLHQFNYPTVILHGPGAIAALASRLGEAGAGPLLMVTDPGLVEAGVAGRVEAALTDAGLAVTVHAEVHANPIEDDVIAGAARYLESGAAGIVAVGGGSAMDTGKAIAVLATHDGPLSRFDDGKGGDALITEPLPPVYAVATTAGTGSEVGRAGVIVCADTGVKTLIFHPDLMPRIAVLDPELTVGLPPGLTAATGMDAFTHGLEAYLARGYHPIADAMAVGCMELVVANLPRAVEDGADLDARGNMLVAATMGAAAFQKGVGMIHSMAHPMSTRYGTHHGLANAVLLAPALRWQLRNKAAEFTRDLRDRYRRIAAILDPERDHEPSDLPDTIAALVRRVGIADTLPGLGLMATDIEALADEAFADVCHHCNPIDITRDDFAAAFASCL